MGFPFGDLGPATVIWDADATAVDLGPMHGGVVFKDEVKYKEIHEDGLGELPSDAVFIGRVCTLTCKMTESTLAKIALVTPGATVVGSVMTVKAGVGTQMRALAKKVTVKRLIDNAPSAVTTEWLTLLAAYPTPSGEFTFDVDTQRIITVTFIAFPLVNASNLGELWKIGA